MNAVHVTVNGVLVRRNNPQQEHFIEAPEVSGYMRPFFVDFFLPFFFVGTYFFHPIQMFQPYLRWLRTGNRQCQF